VWFDPHGKLLSEDIAASNAEVLGWSDVDGVRCVAVLVKPRWDAVYELDPARGFVPLRVRAVTMGDDGDEDFKASHAEEMVAGRTVRPFAWFTATELRDLGGGAWVPARVEQVFRIGDEQRETAVLTATDHVEHVRRGVVGSVLSGAGQLQVSGKPLLLRFDDDDQWEVPDRMLGFRLGDLPWPPPVWLRPWALTVEIAALVGLAVLVARVVSRRGAATA
jgi:hypothetical protein